MRKRLLYLTNIRLTSFMWDGKALSEEAAFENDERGWRMFSDFLADADNLPASLLADLIEEDFQRDAIPHVMGKARHTLLQRKLGQLYRETPYTHASFQGREKEGRKDDRFLFSAITNVELPKPWLHALLRHKVPLAGIYSFALLSPLLFDKLDAGNGPVLLLTHQAGGLRQSYFHDGRLRFSRLTPLAEFSFDSFTDVVVNETTKTRQFLASTRQLARGERIDIIIVTAAGNVAELRQRCEDTPDAWYHFVDPEEAAGRLRLKLGEAPQFSEPLFLSLLAQKAPAGHYALPESTRFYRLWQARIALYTLSAAALAGGVLSASASSWDAYEASREIRRLEAETRSSDAKYQALISSMPAIVANANDMKLAVDIHRMLSLNAPEPAPLLRIIGKAFDAVPQLQLNRLQWQAKEGDAAADPAAVPTDAQPPAAVLGLPKPPQQVVILEGEVVPFNHDYRAALGHVQQLAAELGKNKQLQVAISRAPLDTSPANTLQGQAGNSDAPVKAEFALKLVWKP